MSSHVATDAGANTLLRVSELGKITALAVLPSRAHGRPTDAVPTAVALGPDGAYYVGELTGAPFAVGAARVYRVVPGQEPEVFLEDFTAIIDLTFGPDCSLYVLQHATEVGLMGPGALIRITPYGTRTLLAHEGLLRPTAVVVAPWDAVAEGDSAAEHEEGTGKLTLYVPQFETCVGSDGMTGAVRSSGSGREWPERAPSTPPRLAAPGDLAICAALGQEQMSKTVSQCQTVTACRSR